MSRISFDRRRHLVVDPLQLRITAVGILYIVAVVLCVSLPLLSMMRAMTMLLDGHSAEMIRLFEDQQHYTKVSFVSFCLAITGMWVFFSLWRSHRIAGPIIRITRFVHDMAAGAYNRRMSLRSSDEFQDLARALNNMAERLEQRDAASRHQIQQLIEANRHEPAISE